MEQRLLPLRLLWTLLCLQSSVFLKDIGSLGFPTQSIGNAKHVAPTIVVHFSMHRTNTLGKKDEEAVNKYVGLLQQVIKSIPTIPTQSHHTTRQAPVTVTSPEPSSSATIDTVWRKIQSRRLEIPTKTSQTTASTSQITTAITTFGGLSGGGVDAAMILHSDITLAEKTVSEHLVVSPENNMEQRDSLEPSKGSKEGHLDNEGAEEIHISVSPTATVLHSVERKEKGPNDEDKILNKMMGLLQDFVRAVPTNQTPCPCPSQEASKVKPSPTNTVDSIWRKLKSKERGKQIQVLQAASPASEITTTPATSWRSTSETKATFVFNSPLTPAKDTAPQNLQSEPGVAVIVHPAESQSETPPASATRPVEISIAVAGGGKAFSQPTPKTLPSLVEKLKNGMNRPASVETSTGKLPLEGGQTPGSPGQAHVSELLATPVQASENRKEKLPQDEVKTLRKIVGLLRSIMENIPTKEPSLSR